MTGSRLLLIIVAAVLAAILVWWLIPTEKDRIRARIEDAGEALEAEDVPGVLSIIDQDVFEDPFNVGLEGVDRALAEAFETFDDIDFTVSFPRIVLEKGKREARVTVRFAIMGEYDGQRGYIVGTIKENATARLEMSKGSDDQWRIVGVTHAVLPGVME